MVTRVVVDASVALKWVIPEIHADAAQRLLADAYQLEAPDLIFAEFGNALWKQVRRSLLSRVEARAALTVLYRTPMRVHGIQQVADRALELAALHDRTVYDCIYLALAERESCRMVTADHAFFAKIGHSPMRAHITWIEAV